MRSPKLETDPRARSHYRYYAGYTPGFVEDMLTELAVLPGDSDTVVLDPWNGAGTTTITALQSGLSAEGFDLNPAAVLIARARLTGRDAVGSLVPLASEICTLAAADTRQHAPDLLGTWFGTSTALELRRLERAIYHLLVQHGVDVSAPVYDGTLPQSNLAATYYVLLFEVVRALVKKYVPTNPTWIKHPTGPRVGVRRDVLHAAFIRAVEALEVRLQTAPRLDPAGSGTVSIQQGVSTSLPLRDGSVDTVLSSPPYCTRLDYVKGTLPELAVLGFGDAEVRDLRDKMIGTPTIVRDSAPEPADPSEWGTETEALLETVTNHPSVASATYYRKFYLQYFDGMWRSLAEIKRVLKPGAAAVLVVQDSYYKDVHVDLPALVADMAMHAGWSDATRQDFSVPRTMAQMNPASRKYKQGIRAVESAVVLKR